MTDLEKIKKIVESADKPVEEFEDSEGINILALQDETDDEIIELMFDEDGRYIGIRKEI